MWRRDDAGWTLGFPGRLLIGAARRLRAEVGAERLAQGRQVHGTRVVVDAEGIEDADGQVTTAPGVAAMVLVADCLPVVLVDDLDELVRNTQKRDLEVLITIWGTPKWANGGKTPNVAPRRMSDLTAFSRAVASRYSGRFAGIPFVRFYSIWNESNLQLFLAPQFDAKGKSVAPRNYARLAAAAYAGIKAGNPLAKVAVGSTSSAGASVSSSIRVSSA